MTPTAFPSAARLRAWLVRNHARKKELLLECSKQGIPIPMLTRKPRG
jgi:hypothetical protein